MVKAAVSQEIVKVTDLHKSYGAKVVLNDLSFSVPEATIYGLVGKNGAGKTTLLNILSGITAADSGECIISGEAANRGEFRSGIVSYLPDIPNFYDYLSVQEYVYFILSGRSKKYERVSIDIEKLYSDLGLNSKARIKALSRGNKQKLGILAAIITKPKVLILDEPTSSLDPVGRRDVMSLIKELRNQGMTIIFSTHILNDLESVCDRIGFLHNGAIQCEVDLTASDKGKEVYEVIFSPNDCDVNIQTLERLLPDYHISKEPESNKVVFESASSAPDQKKLFSGLALAENSVISVKRVYQHDLESIMMEVLSQ